MAHNTRTFLSFPYVSAGCNRTPFSADWGKNGIVAYGYSHAIALYKYRNGFIKGGSIVQTLVGHTDRVNCVRWIRNNNENDETELVSGSTDNNAIVWQISDCNRESKLLAVLKGHTGAVTCIAAQHKPIALSGNHTKRNVFIVTTSVDSTARIWAGDVSDITEQQVLSFGSGFALTVEITIIPNTQVPLLAFGGDNHKIQLYVKADANLFCPVLTLSGHEDWIRGLDFAIDENENILLASCAQDHFIRVWTLVHRTEGQKENKIQSVSDLPVDEDISMKETAFHFENENKTVSYAVSLNSVLYGHENWVYSIRWKPSLKPDGGGCHQPLCLLSASMDKTMILWVLEKKSGLWIEEVRVGDIGGNSLGFYGGLFSPCGQSILGHGYQGAFHQWTLSQMTGLWEPQVTGGGHFDSVDDLAWSPSGYFLLSASKDQTTRLHSPWVIKDESPDFEPQWFEVARPQVHGYDLQCIAAFGPYNFASGADEKIVRLFSAPRSFIFNFCQICGHDMDAELKEDTKHLPESANVPTLGLSNKAVFTADESISAEENLKSGTLPKNYFTPISLSGPPSEDQLLQNTLWPEKGKLYGHGYEIYSLAAHPSGRLLASACKAANADNANILLWDTETKRNVDSISGPSLTITDMVFSHNGHFLLAVSRDRTWALFKQQDCGAFKWHSGVDKKTAVHSRLIWACSWSHDDKYFATASRDKKVLIWPLISESLSAEPVSCLSHLDPVTAVSLAPVFVKENKYLVATGLENGQVFLHTWIPKEGNGDSNNWTLIIFLDKRQAHHLTVMRLAFCPALSPTGSANHPRTLQLASCGLDHAVRVYSIQLDNL